MTIVSGMLFNAKAGALVTDERGSYGGRQSDLMQKIYHVGDGSASAIIGTAGSASFAADVIKELHDYFKTEQARHGHHQSPPPTDGTIDAQHEPSLHSGRDIANVTSRAMNKVKRQYINGYLQSQYGLSEIDFIHGRVVTGHGEPLPIDSSIRQRYDRLVDGNDSTISEIFRNHFILLTSDKEGVELWQAWTGAANPFPTPLPYLCTGSGGDAGDAVLRDYLISMPRAERENIDPVEGIAALLRATYLAGETNVGVGGTPHIAIVQAQQKPIIPSERNSRLAMEVVRGTTAGLLSSEFQQGALKSLILNGGEFNDVHRQMQEAAGTNWGALDILLRGYHI